MQTGATTPNFVGPKITEQKKCWELLAKKFDRFQTFRDNMPQGVQTDATTPNIVGLTVLGVIASLLAVVCKRMQQLQTMLGQQCWE